MFPSSLYLHNIFGPFEVKIYIASVFVWEMNTSSVPQHPALVIHPSLMAGDAIRLHLPSNLRDMIRKSRKINVYIESRESVFRDLPKNKKENRKVKRLSSTSYARTSLLWFHNLNTLSFPSIDSMMELGLLLYCLTLEFWKSLWIWVGIYIYIYRWVVIWKRINHVSCLPYNLSHSSQSVFFPPVRGRPIRPHPPSLILISEFAFPAAF